MPSRSVNVVGQQLLPHAAPRAPLPNPTSVSGWTVSLPVDSWSIPDVRLTLALGRFSNGE